MTIKKLFTAAVLSAGILTSLTSSAFEGKGEGGERKGQRGQKFGRMAEQFGLTETQMEQLKEMRESGDVDMREALEFVLTDEQLEKRDAFRAQREEGKGKKKDGKAKRGQGKQRPMDETE